MSEPDHDSSQQDNNGGRRIPPWAGYLLIAADVVRLPLFLVPWIGTLVALSLALPTDSIWIWAGVLILASIATWAAVTRAVAGQASAQGVLGAYVSRLATQTALGRWLTDLLSAGGR